MTPSNQKNSLPGPGNILQTRLDNGLWVLVRENHSSPSVVLNGYLPGGAVLESAEQAGLSAFTTSMMMRGTSNRSFEQINESIEAVGASLNVYSGRHAVGVSGKALAEDFDLILTILGDALQHPVFPDKHVERVRGQRLTALQERDNDTRSMASLLFRKLVYPANHPYSWAVNGYRETISALGRDDLQRFYEGTYGPAGGVLVIVGAVDGPAVVAQVAEALGAWRKPASPTPAFPALDAPTAIRREEHLLAGKTQSDIVLGGLALRRSDPDFYAARLANTILGRFGMMGRLGENVREKLGLAYYSYSSLEANKEPGVWMVIAGVNPANVERCLAAVREEIARLGSEPVTEQELSDSKAFLTGSLPLRLETN